MWCSLGEIYHSADVQFQGFTKALECYKQNEGENKSCALRGLGLLYEHGIAIDATAAFDFFERIVKEELIEDNTYVLVEVENDTESETLFDQRKKYSVVSESIISGEAYLYLGIMNENGQGTTQDHQKALNHFKLSYSYGIERAKAYLEI
ncbi:hypothetical protein K501DRAFT_280360 [Backusella circina FSU 941]|nr:hypothetical protein K501DRAFT_280360 [Backusella circina FSU 941]